MAGEPGTSCGLVWVRVISRPFSRLVQTAPQQYTVPVVVRAQVRSWPALTEATGAGITTLVGTEPPNMLGLPSWPRSFAPQQKSTPSVLTAQVCVAPALIWAQGSAPGPRSNTGPPNAGWPSWLSSFAPQQ